MSGKNVCCMLTNIVSKKKKSFNILQQIAKLLLVSQCCILAPLKIHLDAQTALKATQVAL